MRAAGGGGSGRALPWAACEGWEAKVAACSRLLAPHGGTVGVSEGEPLPEALLTVALLLLMPCEDFAALLRGDDDSDDDDNDGDGDGDGDGGDGGGEGKGKEGKGGKEGKKGKSSDSRAGMTAGGAAGGAAVGGAAGGAAGEGGVARVPMLDSSVLEGEPLLAAAVVQAIVGAVAAAEKRYPAEPTAAPSAVEGAAGVVSAAGAAGGVGAAAEELPGARARRLAMARMLVCGELAALGATRRAALKLLVEIELGEDEDEGEEEGEEAGEEEGEEEEEEEEGDMHGAKPPSAKVQRRA